MNSTSQNPYEPPAAPAQPVNKLAAPQGSWFILSGRNRRGRRKTEWVEADTPAAAVTGMRERGYDDVVLHTDSMAALVLSPHKFNQLVYAGDLLRLLRTRTLLGRIWWTASLVYRKWWAFVLILLGYFLFLAVDTESVGINLVVGAALAYPLLIGIVANCLPRQRRWYRLLDAISWARWEEVLRLAPRLPKTVPPFGDWPRRRPWRDWGALKKPSSWREVRRPTICPSGTAKCGWARCASLPGKPRRPRPALPKRLRLHLIARKCGKWLSANYCGRIVCRRLARCWPSCGE